MMDCRKNVPQKETEVLDGVYKQHEDFLAEFAKLRESQKETVAKLIHELYVKQQEETGRETGHKKD